MYTYFDKLKIIGTLKVEEFSFNTFKLLDDLTFVIGNHTVIVPKGFITDFASVPKKLWGLVGPYGRHTKAAVLHDWLYSSQSKENFSKEVADRLFLLFMEYLAVPKKDKFLLFNGVDKFGKPFFQKKEAEVWYVDKIAWIDKSPDYLKYKKYINMLFGFPFFE